MGTNGDHLADSHAAQKHYPKVELHIHLDGAARPSTIWDLAKKRGLTVPGKDADELAQCIRDFKYGSLLQFLKAFQLFLPSFVADKDAIRRISYELCEDKSKEGVVYFETRFSPHLLADGKIPWYDVDVKSTLTLAEVMDSVVEGIVAGQHDFNIKARLILCGLRQEPSWTNDCVQLSKDYSQYVVGIDMIGEEANVPFDPEIIAAFEEAKRCGIHRTVHAGEAGPASNIQDAVDILHAERIGHGYALVKDEKVYQMIKDKDIHLECCPSCSIYTGSCDADFTKHPCVRFTRDKLNFSLNTDDPTIIGNTVGDEFQLAKKYFGLSDEQAVQVTLNSARSCFLPEPEKLELLQQLRAAYNVTE